jgi:hypothetical protein
MSELRRVTILKQTVGATDEEIQDAIYQVKQIQRQREETLDKDFPIKMKNFRRVKLLSGIRSRNFIICQKFSQSSISSTT